MIVKVLQDWGDSVLTAGKQGYKFSAFLWFILSLISYLAILEASGKSVAAAYINDSAIPFIDDASFSVSKLMHKKDIEKLGEGRVKDIDLDEVYSVRVLDFYKDIALQNIDDLRDEINYENESASTKEIERLKEETSEIIPYTAKEPSQAESSRDKHKVFVSDIDERIKAISQMTNRDIVNAYSDDDSSYNYALSQVSTLIKTNFSGEEAQAFSVKPVNGFWSGGIIINQMFVSHWLWYLPMMISFGYFLLDLLSFSKKAPPSE